MNSLSMQNERHKNEKGKFAYAFQGVQKPAVWCGIVNVRKAGARRRLL